MYRKPEIQALVCKTCGHKLKWHLKALKGDRYGGHETEFGYCSCTLFACKHGLTTCYECGIGRLDSSG